MDAAVWDGTGTGANSVRWLRCMCAWRLDHHMRTHPRNRQRRFDPRRRSIPHACRCLGWTDSPNRQHHRCTIRRLQQPRSEWRPAWSRQEAAPRRTHRLTQGTPGRTRCPPRPKSTLRPQAAEGVRAAAGWSRRVGAELTGSALARTDTAANSERFGPRTFSWHRLHHMHRCLRSLHGRLHLHHRSIPRACKSLGCCCKPSQRHHQYTQRQQQRPPPEFH